MRKSAHILLLGGVLLSIAGCRDRSYRGYEQTYGEYFDPISVVVAVGNPYSKGSGPVEDLEDFAGKDLVIWAFNRDSAGAFTHVRTPEDSIICLASERRAVLDGISNIAKWKDSTLVYPGGKACNNRYDLWAAHVDDLPLDGIQRSESQIAMDIKINGSQDLMVSKAELPSSPSYAYSYLSAQEGAKPVFTMTHCLTRVDLYVQPGITKNFINNMQIQSVTLQSRTSARMVLVDNDPENLGVTFREGSARTAVPLTEPDGKEFNPVRLSTIEGNPADPEALALQKASIQRLGGSFFLSPEQEYPMVMTMDMLGYGDGILARTPVETAVRLVSGESFKQGCRYQVLMTVYGEYSLYMVVQQVPWYSAGIFILDQDAASELIELNVTAEDLVLRMGQSQALEPKLLFTSLDGSMQPGERDDVEFSFASQDETIAAVDSQNGIVTAIKPGETRIIITATRYNPDGTVGGAGVCAVKVKVL